MESEQEPKEILADSTDTQVLPPIKYGEPEPADVILVVEGQEYHVQKMVLAGRSTYFKALFYGGFKEKDEGRIEIRDVGASPFGRLMDFIYRGEISDEYPTFTQFVYVTNIGCGELKTEHRAVDDKKEYIKNFWKASSEVLQLADRFDIKVVFEKYFTRLLACFTCTTANCFVCVTMHIFALANVLKKHDIIFIKEWLRLAEEAKISESDSFKAVARAFRSLG